MVVEAANKRVPVIAGAGSNATAEAIALSKDAREAGADALLQITPYYNRPTQEGLYLHFRAIAEAVPLPIVLYNVPGAHRLRPAAARRSRGWPSCRRSSASRRRTGTVQRTQQILARARRPAGRSSRGEDAINLPLYAVGARGCISVVSNVAPQLVAACWDAHAAGDAAARAQAALPNRCRCAEALFSEASPIPSKAALAMMGRIAPDIRLPLHPMSEAPAATSCARSLHAAGRSWRERATVRASRSRRARRRPARWGA